MPYHAADLRRGRHSETNRAYLITTVVKDRQPIFDDFDIARLAVRELRRTDELGRCHTIAFVLMPDHLHWLMQLGAMDLSAVVGSFKANAAKAVNRWRSTPGEPVWQHGFHDRALRRTDNIAAMIRYLVLNPLQAGLVTQIGDYPHWDCPGRGCPGRGCRRSYTPIPM